MNYRGAFNTVDVKPQMDMQVRHILLQVFTNKQDAISFQKLVNPGDAFNLSARSAPWAGGGNFHEYFSDI